MTTASRKLLSDVLEAAATIRRHTDGIDGDAFKADADKRAIVERHFLIIGEACARLRRKDKPLYLTSRHFHEAVKHRNFLIHVYDLVDPVILWATVRNSLPALVTHCEQLARNDPI